MGQTMTEKILAKHAGKSGVEPGTLIMAKVDLALGNDITAPIAIKQFREHWDGGVFDPERIALVPDHFAPNKDIESAEQCRMMRVFAREHDIKYYFEMGEMGVEHALLPEKGLVLPGELIIGADSHTCTYGALNAFSTGVGSTDLAAIMMSGEVWLKVPETIRIIYSGKLGPWVEGKDLILDTIGRIGVDGALYKSIEFKGETIDSLGMAGRLTMANMAIEAGAKNGIFDFDETTAEYLKGRAAKEFTPVEGDPDAKVSEVIEIDVTGMEPQVAFPHLPSNTRPISEVGDVEIDQSVIGSCTNGRIEDLRSAAKVLKGHRSHENVRLIIIPATVNVYRQAIEEGLVNIFLDSGAVVSTPTCGPCLGGHMGVLAKGERSIATTNRNFVGRMGHPESEVYLSNPAIAAASAVKGRIAGPEDI